MRIGANLIAYDEEPRIARCLDSLRWVDEIVVVVDDRTTDATAEIARRYTDRVVVRPFRSFAEQHQWADDQTPGDWILSMDCDEVVTDELRDEIQRELAAPRFDAYQIPRMDYMFGRWIRHGGWYMQYHTRLYRRGAGRWQRDVHESLEVSGSVGRLRSPHLHFSHLTVEDWVGKMTRYTQMGAKSRYAAGERTNFLRMLFAPLLGFAYTWIWRRGFRDGMHGFVLSALLACYRLVEHLELWDLQQSARGPHEPDRWPPAKSPP